MGQKDYTNALQLIPIEKNRNKSSLLTREEKTVLRSKVGQLLWLTKQTRPDIAFEISSLASKLQESTVEDLKKANKIIRKVKMENVYLSFNGLGNKVEVLLYSDASFGNLADGGSQGGFVVFLRGENGMINPVTWQSRKLRRVARSTLASETLALADGVDCALSVAKLLKELLLNKYSTDEIPIKCYIDNNDLQQALYSKKLVSERRLRIELNAIKQLIQNGEIASVKWVRSEDQLANVLTKHGACGQSILDVFRLGKFHVP